MQRTNFPLGINKSVYSIYSILYSILVCVSAGWQKPRGPVHPADGVASNPPAEDHQAGRSSGEEPRRGGDSAAGGSGPGLRRCRSTRFGVKVQWCGITLGGFCDLKSSAPGFYRSRLMLCRVNNHYGRILQQLIMLETHSTNLLTKLMFIVKKSDAAQVVNGYQWIFILIIFVWLFGLNP